jgi:hypothetical protein
LLTVVAGCIVAQLTLAAPGEAAQVQCGDVIATSVVFENDVTGCEGDAAVTVVGTGVVVDLNGHTVEGTATYGLFVDASASNVRISAGEVTGFGTGVQIEGDATRVSLLRATGNGTGIHVGNGADNDIAADASISLNLVTRNRDMGIAIDQAQRPRVRLNIVRGNGTGIGAFFAPNGRIERNQVISNDRGALASGADATSWLSNMFTANRGDGLRIKDSFSDVIGNIATANGGAGILYGENLVQFAFRSRYGRNKAYRNGDVGISVTEGTTDLGGNVAHANGGDDCVNLSCG